MQQTARISSWMLYMMLYLDSRWVNFARPMILSTASSQSMNVSSVKQADESCTCLQNLSSYLGFGPNVRPLNVCLDSTSAFIDLLGLLAIAQGQEAFHMRDVCIIKLNALIFALQLAVPHLQWGRCLRGNTKTCPSWSWSYICTQSG